MPAVTIIIHPLCRSSSPVYRQHFREHFSHLDTFEDRKEKSLEVFFFPPKFSLERGTPLYSNISMVRSSTVCVRFFNFYLFSFGEETSINKNSRRPFTYVIFFKLSPTQVSFGCSCARAKKKRPAAIKETKFFVLFFPRPRLRLYFLIKVKPRNRPSSYDGCTF